MPDNLLKNLNTENIDAQEVISIRESELLTALRVADEEEVLLAMEELQMILLDGSASAAEKSVAYDSLKELNLNKGKELGLEKKIMEVYSLKAFIKIKNDQIKIVIASKNHDKELANNIIRTVQESFKDRVFITVEFKQ